MCGIVGYLGKGEAYPALIKGLKRLEYRGYDSAGVALISNDGALNVYKAKGKVADLEAFCSDKDISGHVGIAHTRWATHGEPSAVNARFQQQETQYYHHYQPDILAGNHYHNSAVRLYPMFERQRG